MIGWCVSFDVENVGRTADSIARLMRFPREMRILSGTGLRVWPFDVLSILLLF